MCDRLRMVGPELRVEAIAICFKAANFREAGAKTEAGTGALLARYEFFEILVRLAKEKYCPKQTTSISEALDMLKNENMKHNYKAG